MKLKIRWPFVMGHVQISGKFKDHLLPSTTAFTVDLHFSYLHINRAPMMFLLLAFSCLFYPEVKNLKLCPFVMNDLLQILSMSQTFNYC